MSAEFEFSPEREALRATVAAAGADVWPETEVRRLAATDSGFERPRWRRLASELGIAGIALPEEYDGADGGLVDLLIVAEELGGVLACTPLLGTVALSATAVLHAGDDELAKELLPAVASGETVLALAATDSRGAWQPSSPTVRARSTTDGWRLTGEQSHVLDLVAADAVLVLADVGGRTGLFLVAGGAPGMERVPQPGLDRTRRQGAVRFADVEARPVGDPVAAEGAVGLARDRAAVVLAAEGAGGAGAMARMAFGHARDRLQFGRPIGSFQAVKHRCADIHVAVENARSVVYHAGWAVDEGTDDPAIATSLARVVCADAVRAVAKDGAQVLGGLGFTWEHPAHLYLKRAVADAALLGGRAHDAQRLAERALPAAVGGG